MKVCKNCGRELQDYENVCPVCGQAYVEDSVQIGQTQPAAAPMQDVTPINQGINDINMVNDVNSQAIQNIEVPNVAPVMAAQESIVPKIEEQQNVINDVDTMVNPIANEVNAMPIQESTIINDVSNEIENVSSNQNINIPTDSVIEPVVSQTDAIPVQEPLTIDNNVNGVGNAFENQNVVEPVNNIVEPVTNVQQPSVAQESTVIDNNLNNVNNISEIQNTNEQVNSIVEPQSVNTPAGVNQTNTQTVNTEPAKSKDNKTLFVVLVSILGIIILGLIVFIVIKVVNISSNNGEPTVINSTTTSRLTTTVQNVSNGNTITLKGYTFKIPNNFTYKEESGSLYLVDSSKTMVAGMEPTYGYYDTYKGSIEELKIQFSSNGYIVNGNSIKNSNNREYILLDLTYQGKQMYYVITKLDSSAVLQTALVLNNISVENALSMITPIVNDVKQEGSSDLTEKLTDDVKLNSNILNNNNLEDLLK